MSCTCCIVPPGLLRGIAESTDNSDDIRAEARSALDSRHRITRQRWEHLDQLIRDGGRPRRGPHPSGIVPRDLLRHVAESDAVDDDTRARAKRDLESYKQFSSSDQQVLDPPKESAYRYVYDTHNSQKLPGELVRTEGQPSIQNDPGDAINEAYDNGGKVVKFYKDVFNWNSIDNEGMDIVQTVHYGKGYQNAFWDGQQMVYGDGGKLLYNFTGALDVIGHELSHGVTQYTSPLAYDTQSGALNESISDVFGVMSKQYDENIKSEDDDWLIGENILLPGVKGVALRSMKAPGTAYNDPRLGRDSQPDNMSNYQDLPNTEEGDYGGVHTNSGIPNKAFYNAAIAFGGYSWEKAGLIWWKARISGQIPQRCTFQQFADITVDSAKQEFGDDAATKVRQAWTDVGVVRGI